MVGASLPWRGNRPIRSITYPFTIKYEADFHKEWLLGNKYSNSARNGMDYSEVASIYLW